jgi:hypothetical protein
VSKFLKAKRHVSPTEQERYETVDPATEKRSTRADLGETGGASGERLDGFSVSGVAGRF